MDPQQVINESRTMLEDFLARLGMFRPGQRVFDPHLLDRLSDWIEEQQVAGEAEFSFLTARVAAFISEYLIDGYAGEFHVEGGRILLRLAIRQGVFRAFDPFAVAVGIVQTHGNLKQFLHFLDGLISVAKGA